MNSVVTFAKLKQVDSSGYGILQRFETFWNLPILMDYPWTFFKTYHNLEKHRIYGLRAMNFACQLLHVIGNYSPIILFSYAIDIWF